MAVGDQVRATRDIRTFVPSTMKIRADAIPSGTRGQIVLQDDDQGFVSVKFANNITANFGEGLVDGLDSVELLPARATRDIMTGQERSVQQIRTQDTGSRLDSRILPRTG